MILQEIIKNKSLQLETDKQEISIASMEYLLKNSAVEPVRSFKEALLQSQEVAIIGEIKQASPSQGVIRADFAPLKLAKIYQSSGIQALSVLTERKFFHGKDEYLSAIRPHSIVPILRKDFILDRWQIYQSRILGADALLLIVSILSLAELIEYYRIAQTLDLECLVEVHDRQELEMALAADVEIIGINNRNLNDFSISLQTTENLIQHIPQDKVVVSESGIQSSEDLRYLQNLGVDGLLIGESLIRASNIKEKIRSLRGGFG